MLQNYIEKRKLNSPFRNIILIELIFYEHKIFIKNKIIIGFDEKTIEKL